MNDDTKLTKQDLLDFLDSQVLCVISSNGENGYPNSATVAFSNNDNLEFVIGTSLKSRKAGNIANNKKVAMTITDADKRWTVQLEGDIRQLSAEEFEQKYSEKHYRKLPFSLPFKNIPDQANFMVTPVHLKLTDASKKPWQVIEF
jgi:general stress protein 26